MINSVQGTPALIVLLLGEKRFYDLDTTDDGGFPSGTTPAQLALSAVNEETNASVPSMIPDGTGGVISVTGNLARVAVAGVSTGTYRVYLSWTNNNGAPCKSFWRFRVVV